MNTYVCKFDNAAFSSEEDLINHIKENYMTVVKEGEDPTEIQKIYSVLNDNFPEAKVNVQTDTEDGGYRADLIFDFTCFSFQIGEGDWNYYYSRFVSVEAAVEFYKNFFTTAEEIKRRVFDTHNLKIEVQSMRESGSDHDDYDSITFKFMIGEEEQFNTYEFRLNYSVDDFINTFNQYFIKVAEGEVKKITDDGYFVDYVINGIPLSGMVERGKKFRFEIIE